MHAIRSPIIVVFTRPCRSSLSHYAACFQLAAMEAINYITRTVWIIALNNRTSPLQGKKH